MYKVHVKQYIEQHPLYKKAQELEILGEKKTEYVEMQREVMKLREQLSESKRKNVAYKKELRDAREQYQEMRFKYQKLITDIQAKESVIQFHPKKKL